MAERIPQTPPVINPLTDTKNRPLWSVMIPTYNCISYLKQTLETVLSQDWGEAKMQIEVVDDHSTDGDVEALVQSVGKGRIAFFKQERNRAACATLKPAFKEPEEKECISCMATIV